MTKLDLVKLMCVKIKHAYLDPERSIDEEKCIKALHTLFWIIYEERNLNHGVITFKQERRYKKWAYEKYCAQHDVMMFLNADHDIIRQSHVSNYPESYELFTEGFTL